MKFNISEITSDNLKSGNFRNELPEVYALKDLVENNPWHLKQNVFNHTIEVVKNIEIFLDTKVNKLRNGRKLKHRLDDLVGKYNRKELLIISALLHDIAKPVSAVKDKSGTVQCPNHEYIGSETVGRFSLRFGFYKDDEKFVKKIVYYHGYISEVVNKIISKGRKRYYINQSKKEVGDIYNELLILLYSDLLGSDLKRLDPKNFLIRKKLLLDLLQNN